MEKAALVTEWRAALTLTQRAPPWVLMSLCVLELASVQGALGDDCVEKAKRSPPSQA